MTKLKKPTSEAEADRFWYNTARWRKYTSEFEMWDDFYQIPFSIAEVASRAKTSYATARRRMMRCGVLIRKRGMYRTRILDVLEQDGIDVLAICHEEGKLKKASEKLGVHYHVLRSWLLMKGLTDVFKKGRPPLDDETIEEIRRLRSLGFPLRYIGEVLDVNHHSVWKYTKERSKKKKMSKEKWKLIKESSDYEVSNKGRIRSYKGCTFGGKLIALCFDSKGYLRFNIWIDGRCYSKSVARAVLEAFVGPCPVGHQCHHKDGIKANPDLENLEWTTQEDNMGYDWLAGRRTGRRSGKLKEGEVWLIRKLLNGGIRRKLIHEMFKISYGHLYHISTGRLWPHIKEV